MGVALVNEMHCELVPNKSKVMLCYRDATILQYIAIFTTAIQYKTPDKNRYIAILIFIVFKVVRITTKMTGPLVTSMIS